ncbi:MAG: hypothetical protein HOV97_05025 [Nonomuraea sp.]|nr:hypothetical protein [Nonomuraea sp.]
MTQRWTFTDPVGGTSWTTPINPNQASSPFPTRSLQLAPSNWADVGRGLQRLRVFEAPPQPVEWQFGGVLRTKEHHDALRSWAKKSNEIRVSDHLGRTFEVIIKSFRPVERRPTPTVSWRMTYTVTALVLRRVA